MRRSGPALFILFTLTFLPMAGPGRTGAPQDSPPLEITYIANEGYLIVSGNQKVLIDALQRGGIDTYAAPPPKTLEEMETAQGRFASVGMVLVSHYHRDHFHAASVARHLETNPHAILISSPQVVEAVRAESAGIKRARPSYPKGEDRSRHEEAGMRLEIFRLPHGTGRFASIQNLGQIVTIGGRKLLHIGDAEMIVENFSRHRLPEDKIDFAFVPYWFLDDPAGQRIVREHIRPKHLIAMHIPPAELGEVSKKIRVAFPSVIVFTRQLETHAFK